MTTPSPATVTHTVRMSLASRTVQFIDGLTVLQARHSVERPQGAPFIFTSTQVRDQIDPRMPVGVFSAVIAALVQKGALVCVTEDRSRNRQYRVTNWSILQTIKQRHFSADGAPLAAELRLAAAMHYEQEADAAAPQPEVPQPEPGLPLPAIWSFWTRLFRHRRRSQMLLRLARIEAKLDHLITIWES